MAREGESLRELLGGWQPAVETAVPVVAFAAGWLAGGRSIPLGAGVAAWRLAAGRRPIGTVFSLLVVCVGALVALHTGRAADFFAVRVLTNAASALAWAASILIRWPLLGVVVGVALGQRTRWRRDPALLSAYSRASWIWVGQYLVRVAVMLPLWYAGHTVALGITRVVLTWPLVAACLAVSYWVVRRRLPEGHPGLRRPQ